MPSASPPPRQALAPRGRRRIGWARAMGLIGVLAAGPVWAGAKKAPAVAVQFFIQAEQRDGATFTTTLTWQGRTVFVSKLPLATEQDFVGMYPYRAVDGSFAVAFRLHDPGRLALQTISVAKRGGRLYAVVSGRVITPIAIDRIVSDGIISVPFGLTEMEIRGLGDRIPLMKEAKR